LAALQPFFHTVISFNANLKDTIFVMQCSVPKFMEGTVQGCQVKAHTVPSK